MISRSKATFKDNYKHFFVTIQRAQKKEYVDSNDLLMVKRELKSRFPSMQIYKSILELGSVYQQLHIHLLLRLSEYFLFKEHTNISGFRLFWRPIKNLPGINSYLEKDTLQYTQQDIKNLNYYNHFYGFI